MNCTLGVAERPYLWATSEMKRVMLISFFSSYDCI